MTSRTIIPITGPLVNRLQRIAFDKQRPAMPELPPVVGGEWGGVSLESRWGPLTVEGPSVVWTCERKQNGTPGDDFSAAIDRLSNSPAKLRLANGLTLEAGFGHWVSSGSGGLKIEFDLWTLINPAWPPRLWSGTLHGGGFRNGNLTIQRPRRNLGQGTAPGESFPVFTSTNLRLQGNYVWYVIDNRKEEPLYVVVDTGGKLLDPEFLRRDLVSLELTFGTPLQLDTLVGTDEPGNVCGCAGVSFGGNRRTQRRRSADGPVPDNFHHEGWLPVFFNRVALAMTKHPTIPWGMASVAYLDGVTDATIDGQYLKLHVGIEAFADAIVGERAARLLVKDKKAWLKWVGEHEAHLREMVERPEDAARFVDKVRGAMNLPSSSKVSECLSQFDPPLEFCDELTKELSQRNISVHRFSMLRKNEDYDIEREVTRIDMLKTALAAIISRVAEYKGPISGWDRTDGTNWKPSPPWRPSPSEELQAEALTDYVCGEAE